MLKPNLSRPFMSLCLKLVSPVVQLLRRYGVIKDIATNLKLNNGTPKVYKFTRNNKYLNDEERYFYEEHGYLIKRNLVDHTLLDECKQRFVDIAERKIPKGKWVVVTKNVSPNAKNLLGEHAVEKIQFLSYDDVFYKHISYGPIIDVIESLIGPNISVMQSTLINKSPNLDVDISKYPIHQDAYYFPIEPLNSLVTCWTAMEDVDENNGCVYVYRGTHKKKLYSHHFPTDGKRSTFHEIVEYKKLLNDTSKVYLTMKKGDVVFFHPLLFHGSGPNLTTGFRKAIIAHYVDSGARFVEVQGTIREKIMGDLTKMFQKVGYPVDYRNFWRLKTRLVRGEPGTFQHGFLDKL